MRTTEQRKEYDRNRMREKRKSKEFVAKEREYNKKRWKEGKTWKQTKPEEYKPYIAAYGKIWKQQNRDKVNEYGRRATAEGRSWQQRHPEETEEYMNNYVKTRYKTDPHFRNIFMIRGNHRYYKDELITPETRCGVCNSKENLELHHIKYIYGKEGLQYIKILCRNCHRKIHQKK